MTTCAVLDAPFGVGGGHHFPATIFLAPRTRGGLLNKARRGELTIALPLGFVYDEQSRVVLDPDLQVQQAIRALFSTFGRVGSASGTARAFRKEKILFPKRAPARGLRANSSVSWKQLDVSTVPLPVPGRVLAQHRAVRPRVAVLRHQVLVQLLHVARPRLALPLPVGAEPLAQAVGAADRNQ